MTDFCDLPKAIIKTGAAADVPDAPSDRQSLMWDWGSRKLYGATESVGWAELLSLAVDRIMLDEDGTIMIDEAGYLMQTE